MENKDKSSLEIIANLNIPAEEKEQLLKDMDTAEEKKKPPEPQKPVKFDYEKANGLLAEKRQKLSKTIDFEGREIILNTIKLSDISRISEKIPYWLEVIGYTLADIKNPESPFEIRAIFEKIINAVFGGFEAGAPNAFAASIIEEACALTGEEKIGKTLDGVKLFRLHGLSIEEILLSDFDKLAEFLYKIYEVNSNNFFLRSKFGALIAPIVSPLLPHIARVKATMNELKQKLVGGADSGGSTPTITP